jgi:2-polyprenyl-6-methoxyphenol hydroxylase-like FAD-dependent oxidoreductase
MSYKSVVVIGAGPIGLMAAIEARQNFVKNVTLIEKRRSYTRTNVPYLATPIVKHLEHIGVSKDIWGDRKTTDSVELSQMEEGLFRQAKALGIKIERGYVAEGLMGRDKNRHGRYKSIAITIREWDDVNKCNKRMGEIKTLDCDLLIVCSGGAAAADPVVVQKLGFTFHKLQAKNYGAYGIFTPLSRDPNTNVNTQDPVFKGLRTEAQKITGFEVAYNTPEHNYLLVTLAQCPRDDFKMLQRDSKKLREVLQTVGHSMTTTVLTEIKEVEKNVGLFKIAIQRAQQFYSKDYPAVLVGDAAVTPHPQAGSGIGTGFAGFEELQKLFAALKKAHRSNNNEAVFQNFNTAYELHASRKALEGTGLVLSNLIKMLNGWRTEVNAEIASSRSTAAKSMAQDMTRTADALIQQLTDEQTSCKKFVDLLKGDEPDLLDWDTTVGDLWNKIGATYKAIKSFTDGMSMLTDRLEKIEPLLKLKAA